MEAGESGRSKVNRFCVRIVKKIDNIVMHFFNVVHRQLLVQNKTSNCLCVSMIDKKMMLLIIIMCG